MPRGKSAELGPHAGPDPNGSGIEGEGVDVHPHLRLYELGWIIWCCGDICL